MMKDFYKNGKIVRGLNPYFISLIPKKPSPQIIDDYRLISLISGAYKIISKVLANRLAKVIDSIIGVNQSAFIAGRNIMDGVIVLNEALDETKRRKAPRFFFKVDFSKAYDSVNWSFLEEMLRGFNFCDKWRMWIKACVESASAAALVNGSPCGEFKLKKGLRQGDPIFPFLYLIVAEGLGLLVHRAMEEGILKPDMIGREKVIVSHLQYADDTIFLCTGELEILVVIKRILRLYEFISRLKVNFLKSMLYGWNMEENVLETGASLLDCERGGNQFQYLGMKIGINPHISENWSWLVQRIKNRIACWVGKNISLGGRATLVQFVISAIPIYAFFLLSSSKNCFA